MKHADLFRGESSDQGTPGILIFGNQYVYTLELPWRNNQRKMSCIPTGTYKCKLRNSPKFGSVYWLTDTPGRDFVLIHSGNFAGAVDKGFSTNVEGCILTGLSLGTMRNQRGVQQQAIFNSRAALRKFMDWANREDFTLGVA